MARLCKFVPFHLPDFSKHRFTDLVLRVVVAAVDHQSRDTDLVEIGSDIEGLKGSRDVDLGRTDPVIFG